METLLEWDNSIMQSALAKFHIVCAQQLSLYEGYMVEERQGYMLAAFCRPGAAVSWADSCLEALLRENWWVGGRGGWAHTHWHRTPKICVLTPPPAPSPQ